MKSIVIILFIFFTQSCFLNAVAQANDEKNELSELLDQFLAGASVNDVKMHDRFWAEDLIYTSSSGSRTNKAEIMSGLNNQESNTNDDTPVYHAEDVQIQFYGEAAVVAFRMIATFNPGSNRAEMQFYNTGTFIRKDNQWKAVAWHATRIPD